MKSLLKKIEELKTSLHEGVVAINLCSNRANLIIGLHGVMANNGRTIFPNDVSFKSINSIGESNAKAVILIDKREMDNFKSHYNLPIIAIDSNVKYNCFFTAMALIDLFEKNTSTGFV